MNIPEELKAIPRWTTWHLSNGKKLPFSKNKTTAISEPSLRLSFQEACAQKNGGGLGFVFIGDGLGGVDLDACRNPDTGELTPWAQDIVKTFDSYTEISPSKTGVKIFAFGAPSKISPNEIPMPGENIKGKRPAIEAYSNGRYFTVTGEPYPGSCGEIKNNPEAWAKLIQKLKDNHPQIAEGNRNNKLTSLAGGLRSQGKDADEILTFLLAENIKFTPPLPEIEVKTIAKSVSKYPAGKNNPGLGLNDVGNALRFKARHGENLLFCYPWKSWLVWDGSRFKVDENGEAVRRAKDTAVSIIDEAKAAYSSGDQKAQAIMKHAATTQQRKQLENMLWAAQSELPVRIDELDQHDELLNLKNGTLDLKSLELRPHRREDRLTKLSPVNLDGDAKCPRWLLFLDKALNGDKELIAFIQRAVGYSLTGETSEHVLFLLHGTGANGKSTFIEIVLCLLGEYGRPCEFKTFLVSDSEAVRNDLAGLVGVRFVSAVEVGEGKQLDEAVVKQVTGGDTITTRFLFKEFFDFRPRFKLWLAANSKPEIRGVDEAIWRRVLLIPFEVTIPKDERDRDLGKKLKEELPGILAWAVEGLRAWQNEGLNPPKKIIAATEEYREESDFLGPFIESCFVKGEKLFVSNEQLKDAYQAFAGADAVKPRTLAKMLKARGFKADVRKFEDKTHRGWIGLGLPSATGAEFEKTVENSHL